MAAGPITLYQANLGDLRLQDLLTATVKLFLHASTYTPSTGTAGHSVAADLAGEIASGGYRHAGIEVAPMTAARPSGGARTGFGVPGNGQGAQDDSEDEDEDA